MKVLNKILNKSILPLFNLAIFLYLFGGVFAPIARHLGWDAIADLLYFVYGFMCHQRAERSIHFFDYQMAFCTRDFSIFLAAQIVGLLAFFKTFRLKPISPIWLIIFITPMILDGGLQLFSELLNTSGIHFLNYESTNFSRFVTGVAFGIAFGLYIFPTIQKEFREVKIEQLEIKRRYVVIITFLLSLIIYILTIYTWNRTSTNFKPTNFLDTMVVSFEGGRKLHVR